MRTRWWWWGSLGSFLCLWGGYEYASWYLQSAAANCVDTEVKRAEIGGAFTATWLRRNCSGLYGGPFTVVNLHASTFPYKLRGPVQVIEIEDESGNFSPEVRLAKGELVLDHVPEYLKYRTADQIFGMNVRVNR